MKNHFKTGVVFSLCFLVLALNGQDFNFTQYFNAPTYYNPAFTGISKGLTVRSMFRNQLPKQLYGFNSFSFSADLGDRSLPGFGGVGIVVNSDNIGTGIMSNLSMGLNLSARIRFSDYFSAMIGVRASVVQKYMNWDELVFDDQINGAYGTIYPNSFTPADDNTKMSPDFGTGVLLEFTSKSSRVSGTAGFAADHLFTPDQSFLPDYTSRLPRKYVVHADIAFDIGKQRDMQHAPKGAGDPFKLSPGIQYQKQQNMDFLQVGMNVQKFNFTLGSWYKTVIDLSKSDNIVLMAGYRFLFGKEMNIRITYSHDFPVNRSQYGPGEPNEISLIFGYGGLNLFGKGGKKPD